MKTESSTPAAAHAPQEVPPRFAYLLSQYPASADGFFRQHITALRACGLVIETASINRLVRPLSELSAADLTEARDTFYLRTSRPAKLLTTLLGVIFSRPAVLLRGLAAVHSAPGLPLWERAGWLLPLAQALLVGRWMRKRGLNHLHASFGGSVATAALLTHLAWKIPFSLTLHGPEEFFALVRNGLPQKIGAASFVFCTSDFCKDELLKLVEPGQRDKFEVIRLGVDPLVLTPSSRAIEHTLSPGRLAVKILCTARLVRSKGQMVLLQASKLLLDRGHKFHLTLVGAGPELSWLQSFVAQNRLGERVFFTSAFPHPQALSTLRRADLFVLPSLAEGLPVELVEAMSLGLPCVSTTAGGVPELIRNGIDGLLVPPGDTTALAAALEALLLNPNLGKNLGASARQRVIAQYNLPLNQQTMANSFKSRLAASFSAPAKASKRAGVSG